MAGYTWWSWRASGHQIGQADTGQETMDLLDETVAAIVAPDIAARTAAGERLDRMTKPRGSLGSVEDVAVTLAGIAGTCPPPVPEPAAVAVFFHFVGLLFHHDIVEFLLVGR